MLLLPSTTSRTPLLDVIHCCDCMTLLRTLPDKCVNCVVTSPPYFGLRDYGVKGQIGLEPTPVQFVQTMVAVFREVRRVLRDDGTVWLNLGDSYAGNRGNKPDKPGYDNKAANGANLNFAGAGVPEGLKEKDLMGIPWRVAFGLQDDGWYLRSDIIWHKPNPMPESVTDRPTKAHEYVFLLTKSERYWYDADAVREPAVNGDPNPPRGSIGVINNPLNKGNRFRNSARYVNQGQAPNNSNHSGDLSKLTVGEPLIDRNRRSVWTVATEPTPFAHFATFPQKLIEPMILAGCPVGGTVLDPFMGSGTTALVARKLGRHYLGCDLNPDYVALAKDRLRLPFQEPIVKRETRFDDLPLFAGAAI